MRRRRECESCEFRFTTFERIEDSLPMVIKKGGQRESFDRYKILSGLKKACEKRPVSVMQMEDVVKSIEAHLLEVGDKEIQSRDIGELVIDKLHDLDQVAYVRFASVYREFSDVSEFMDALRQLAVGGAQAKNVFSLTAGRKSVIQNDSNAKADQKQQELHLVEKPPRERS